MYVQRMNIHYTYYIYRVHQKKNVQTEKSAHVGNFFFQIPSKLCSVGGLPNLLALAAQIFAKEVM